ncbi:MAG: MBL fold metallo-hydrolase [Clostridia bacterium]|nr:MBL fold metallo-hydrolase [Clostridia bacterium]
MKKLLSLVLALVLVLTSLVTLSACTKPKDIDFTDYKLIYAKDVSTLLSDKITAFATTLSGTVGERIKLSAVEAGAAEEKGEELEILVGNTNRPETAKALKKIKGHGYIITVIGSKLVIVGTTNLFTGMALDEFVTKYCGEKADSSVLSIEKTVCEKMEVVSLDKDWRLVYSDRLDASSADSVQPDRQPADNKEGFDYPVVVANQLKNKLESVTEYRAMQYQAYSDATAKASNVKGEILVGPTTREQSVAFINSLGNVDRYGISVSADTVVVAGAGDVTLRQAAGYFGDVLADACFVNEEGDKTVVLPVGFVGMQTATTDWVTDFPKPEGENILLSGSTDVADNAVEYYYTGSGVTAAAYKAYCEKLEAAGYIRYMENEVEDSIFRTYVNEAAKITLNVTYCAYKHAEAQKVTFYEPAIRIVSASLDDNRINLIPEELLTIGSGYTRVTDTIITAVQLDYDNDSYGNCYVIVLEDGSYIMYDSGFGGKNNNNLLQDAITGLHKQMTGSAPSKFNPIHIRAWYLSHGHGDHYTNFYEFAKNNNSMIKFDYIITNFPSATQTYNCYDPNLQLSNNLDEFVKTMSGVTYIKVHSGQKFFIGNVEIEVLYTHEDIYPEMIHRYNDSSVALRTTVYHTDGQGNITAGSKPLTTLWLGDTQHGGSACMRAMYGSYLKSDQVQIAHHGGTGCELELYQLVKPECVWYPHKVEAYNDVMEKGKTSQKGSSAYISYHTVTMSSVKYIIISDFYNVAMTVEASGANYGLYDAATNPKGLKNASDTWGSRKITYGTYVIKR